MVTAGEKYEHKNGNIYTVLFLTNIESKLKEIEHPIDVIYRGPKGNLWSRRLSDWNRSFTLLDEVEDWSKIQEFPNYEINSKGIVRTIKNHKVIAVQSYYTNEKFVYLHDCGFKYSRKIKNLLKTYRNNEKY